MKILVHIGMWFSFFALLAVVAGRLLHDKPSVWQFVGGGWIIPLALVALVVLVSKLRTWWVWHCIEREARENRRVTS